MRKILFAAIAALAITSCSQEDEYQSIGQKAEINFGTIVSNSTRAAVTDLKTLQESGFEVYAYNTGDKSMKDATTATLYMNTPVKYENTSWGYTGTFYWPFTDKLQFFAYATDEAVKGYALVEGAKYPTFNYTIQPLAKDQKDLVVATAIDQTKQDNALTLAFTHVLTQVNFSAIAGGDFTYRITSLAIDGVANGGTYSYETGWNASGTLTNYAYPVAEDNSIAKGTATVLDQTNGALMLMPQAMTVGTKIQLDYEVYNQGVLINKVTGQEVSLKDYTSWAAGKKIRYTLTLTGTGATISFAPSVDGWGEETSTTTPVVPAE